MITIWAPDPSTWVLQKANVGRLLEDAVGAVRVDARLKPLKDYYFERLALVASNEASTTQAANFSEEYSRAFQRMISRWFGGMSDAASVDCKKAHYPMGGSKVRKSPRPEFTYFEWKMPHSFATELILVFMNSLLGKTVPIVPCASRAQVAPKWPLTG